MDKQSRRETISQSEYLQLLGLLTLAKNANNELRRIELAAQGILQEIDRHGELESDLGGGWTGEQIYSLEPDLDQLLKNLGIKVDDQ